MQSNDPWVLQQLVDRYKLRCEVLEEELADLKELMRQVSGYEGRGAILFDISPFGNIILNTLIRKDLARREDFMLALYGARAGDLPDIKIIDVLICHLRKQLKKKDIRVIAKWGQGYYIPKEDKAKIQALFNEFSDSVETHAS